MQQMNQQEIVSQIKRDYKKKGYYVQKLNEHCQSQQIKQKKIKGIQKSSRKIAQEARQRKKKYYQLLQNQNNELKNQISKLQIQNQQLKLQIQQLKFKNTHNTKQQQSFIQLFQQMKILNRSLITKEKTQMDRSLSVLRDKYGIAGRQRFKQIQCLLNRLVQVIMPMHFRVLMQNSEDNRVFYSLLSKSLTDSTPKFNQIQKNTLLQMRPLFCTYKKEYSRILQNLNYLLQGIRYQNWICQGVIDNFQQKLDSQFVGKLLLALDQSRQHDIYPCNEWKDLKFKQKYEISLPNMNLFQNVQNDQQLNYMRNPANNQSFIFESDNQIFNQLFM